MKSLSPFVLENYLLQHEHKAEFSLCNSGLDGLSLSELLATSTEAAKTLWERQSLGYSEPQGHPLLRQEVSQLYGSLNPGQVTIFSGAAEAIYCGLHTLLSSNDHCIVVTPCYQSLKSIPESVCQVSKISLQPLDGQWQLDIAAIRQAIRPNTTALILNFPNNPTGALPARAVLDELIKLAREFNLTIFSDEVYRGLELPGVKSWPAIIDIYEKGISVGSLSKLYAMPGTRVGWLASPDQSFMNRVIGRRHYTTICNNGAGELLALIALQGRDALLPKHKSGLPPRYRQLRNFMERHEDLFDWIDPQAGCLVFPRLKRGLKAERFALDLLHETGVLILPGQVYEFPGEYLRIGYAGKTLPQALERFENFLAKIRLIA